RGLEYYTGIIFEFHVKELGAQSQVCGGGRYDNLVKEFGGPDIPAAGFAFGLDRLVIAMGLQGVKIPEESKPSVLVIPINNSLMKQAFLISLMLRRKGIKAESSLIKEKLRKALSRANKMGIRYVVIVGPKELNENKVILRDMMKREQKVVPIDSLDEVII
ncbi:MAG: ATP phosphoribosyltransferase regulatory subunit, partial [Thermoprotei archaeon]|nr:ATP phosphoribosyltransferase regulatory subunit [Thermoprotei archaeon]